MAALLALTPHWANAQDGVGSLAQRSWFEVRSSHFHTYSCGPTQAVARLTGRLEQFRAAYSALAGGEAVASPPIVVMAFPDQSSLEGFLPLYHGKPANLSAFFTRGSDENLIVLHLSDSGPEALRSIFHEYSHLLLRRNEQFWPMWLNEGMAEIYSTFEVRDSHNARIGQPIEEHLKVLARERLMPLAELLAVTRQSPQYNERERQGIFYAESWLLAEFLMMGDRPAYKARFGLMTTFLRQGQSSATAFTNAFDVPLSTMESELRRYLDRGRFEPLGLAVNADLNLARAGSTRGLGPAEIRFRLGDELLRIGRLADAEAYFKEALALAPGSPLPLEGLGLLAVERRQPDQAIRWLGEALRKKSASYLAHYAFAGEKLKRLARGADTYARIEPAAAAEIRSELETSLRLMPDFGPAEHLLGFLELLQGENLLAERHLRRAIQFEPERPDYLLSLAQAQLQSHDPEAARHTLQSLQPSYIDPGLRESALKLLEKIGK